VQAFGQVVDRFPIAVACRTVVQTGAEMQGVERGPACEQTKHLEETYTVDGFLAPLQGTPMIMIEAYRRILARAAHGQLPPWVVEQSEPDFRCIRALYEAKC
jgi:hypothetical protein